MDILLFHALPASSSEYTVSTTKELPNNPDQVHILEEYHKCTTKASSLSPHHPHITLSVSFPAQLHLTIYTLSSIEQPTMEAYAEEAL